MRRNLALWVPKTYATWADAPLSVGCPARAACQGVGRYSACGAEADLLDRHSWRVAAGLSRREEWWKDAEILMLRHQLAVAERRQPRAHSLLTWPDRAWAGAARGDG